MEYARQNLKKKNREIAKNVDDQNIEILSLQKINAMLVKMARTNHLLRLLRTSMLWPSLCTGSPKPLKMLV